VKLKPVADQVVAVMGASSGIGRATALRFAEQGAAVVVAARGEPGLRSLVAEIEAGGGRATAVVADVTDPAQVRAVADRAVAEYGRLDTWVHMAGVLLVAGFDDTTPEEFARVLEVNLLGQVHGAKAALPHLRRDGGAFIAMSSMGAKRSIPLQTAYCASKHGIDGFVEALRVELQRDGVPVSVTQIMPGTINTPLFDNARTKMGVKPVAPPPAYPPRIVADAIVHAAQHPVRDLVVGGSAKTLITAQKFAPRLVDAALRTVGYELHDTGEAKPADAPDNLDAPLTGNTGAEGTVGGVALRHSPYTWWAMHRPLGAPGRVLRAGAGLLVPKAARSTVTAAVRRASRPTAAGRRRRHAVSETREPVSHRA
jgi:NAD(P)-dependent dehydrogenase (short-subunit alcohol dehydrogenase family)